VAAEASGRYWPPFTKRLIWTAVDIEGEAEAEKVALNAWFVGVGAGGSTAATRLASRSW
jgi:hypothetical protein